MTVSHTPPPPHGVITAHGIEDQSLIGFEHIADEAGVVHGEPQASRCVMSASILTLERRETTAYSAKHDTPV